MYKKIMVAIDDSQTSQSALAEAIHIARTSEAKLYIVHVADETLLNLHGQPLVSIVNIEAAVASLSAAGNELLAEAMKQAEGIDAEPLLLEALKRRVSETIAEKAKELKVDLIVIGRHGRRGLATFILGSVAEQLARISDASVLLVRKH